MSSQLTTTTLTTPVGPFTLVVSGEEVVASGFTAYASQLMALLPDPYPSSHLRSSLDLGELSEKVQSYFDGKLDAIDDLAVQYHGTNFTISVRKALRSIPAGEIVNYKDLAAKAGRPNATTAVGTACSSNSAALIVPCHRAQRTDGGLGGYMWGLPIKQWLLAHESGATPPPVDELLIKSVWRPFRAVAGRGDSYRSRVRRAGLSKKKAEASDVGPGGEVSLVEAKTPSDGVAQEQAEGV